MEHYKKWNDIVGWAVFGIALLTYMLTLEPTVSFWDCGEYIATSVKLQVGHPPGAPLFQLLGAVMAIFAFGDWTQMAFWVNTLSALSSAFTILFLFWTITALGRKLAESLGRNDQTTMIAILGSGVVGALAYTFSDSFWFSAVEGEVYAMSSFFTAIAFWAILKWEREVDWNPRADRWLILIAFLVGLSVGVHILVFLTVPAITMIYFFKKYQKVTTLNFLIANAIGVGILGVIFVVIIPFLLRLYGFMEITLVNTFGLPFDSGTIFTTLLLAGIFVWSLWYAKQKGYYYMHIISLSIFYIVLGYSSFLTLAIRSNANPPIDENNPEDALSLLAYYKREQYGDFPILYGQYFNSQLDPKNPFKDGKPIYVRDEEAGRYVISYDAKFSERNWDKSTIGFFPRMWSDDPEHIENYKRIANIRNPEKKLTVGQNLKFFFDYQLGHMYWRYFMWNFAGRQNDDQGRYELTKGNWISGIPFIDNMRLGPQKNLPDHMKNNKARNKYYLLPLLLGIFGLWYHFKKNPKDAWAVLLFFLFTGVAVIVYTNQKPFEPRERDYAVVGSFYAYAMWIGLGVFGILDLLREKFNKPVHALAVSALCTLLVPGIMAKENWDDHSRANRYTARDIAKAYLDSCAPNAILFTNGDNDTFPLWYVQEVEGYRTDVRVVNLSLLNTDWYIDQMKRKAYDSDPVPFSLEWNQYKQGTRDVLYYQQRPNIAPANARWMAEDFMKWIKSDDPITRFQAYGGRREFQYYPVKRLRFPVDKEAVLRNKVVREADTASILDYIDVDLDMDYLAKRDIMVIDLLANNDWSRPIYFSITVGSSERSYFFLTEYFRLEGLAYRFVPVKMAEKGQRFEFGKVDTEIMYDNLMNKFQFGNMELPDVYLDETNRRLSYNFRNIYARLASELAAEGQNEKAIKALDFCMEKMPIEKFEFNYFMFGIIEGYLKAGANDKAMDLMNKFADQLDQEIRYFNQFKGNKRKAISQELQNSLQFYRFLAQLEMQYILKSNDFSQSQLYKRFEQASAGVAI